MLRKKWRIVTANPLQISGTNDCVEAGRLGRGTGLPMIPLLSLVAMAVPCGDASMVGQGVAVLRPDRAFWCRPRLA